MDKQEHLNYALEQLIKGNLLVVDEVFSPDYIAHAGGKEYKGHEFIKRFANQLRSAIPDIRIVKVEFLAQDSQTLTWQRTLGGTHKAEMMGIPPSNKKVDWIELVVTRFDNGKIAEEWVVSELAGALMVKLPKE
jgi:predicted ester cyclase